MTEAPPHWTIDVVHASHDEVKAGNHAAHVSRVLLSREQFPNPVYAEEFAAVLAVSIHGGMPTRVSHCL